MHAPSERCRAGWAAAPGPVHNAGNECPGPTEARFVGLSPGRCRPAAKRDQTHHNPGSPRPPAQRRPSPAPCGRFLLPHARVQTQKPRLPRVSCSRARWTSGGRKRKTADSGRKAVRIVFCLRLGKKIPAPHSPAMACTAFRGLAWRRE